MSLESTGPTEVLCQRHFRLDKHRPESPPHDPKGVGSQVFTGSDMCVPYRVVVVGAREKDRERIAGLLQKTFEEVDNHLNPWNEESEVSLFNAGKTTGASVEVSATLCAALEDVEKAMAATSGLFDPAAAGTAQRKRAVWADLIDFDSRTCLLRKKHPESRIDLCGIAKGWWVDCVSDYLVSELGFTEHYVEWGGDLRICGRWSISVSRAEGGGYLARKLDLEDCAVATSGGAPVHPGAESEGVEQAGGRIVTIVTRGSCALTDAFATAALLGPAWKSWDQVAGWVDQTPGTPCDVRTPSEHRVPSQIRGLLKTVPQQIFEMGWGGGSQVTVGSVTAVSDPGNGLFLSVMSPSRLASSLTAGGTSFYLKGTAADVPLKVRGVEDKGDHLAVWATSEVPICHAPLFRQHADVTELPSLLGLVDSPFLIYGEDPVRKIGAGLRLFSITPKLLLTFSMLRGTPPAPGEVVTLHLLDWGQSWLLSENVGEGEVFKVFSSDEKEAMEEFVLPGEMGQVKVRVDAVGAGPVVFAVPLNGCAFARPPEAALLADPRTLKPIQHPASVPASASLLLPAVRSTLLILGASLLVYWWLVLPFMVVP